MAPRITRLSDFSPSALGELKAWLEPWWKQKNKVGGHFDGAFSAYSASNETIADGGNAYHGDYTWVEGPEILDLTDPDNPLVTKEGVYVVLWSCQVNVALTANGGFYTKVEISNPVGAGFTTISPFSTPYYQQGGTALPSGIGAVSNGIYVHHILAGAKVYQRTFNRDGASSRTFVDAGITFVRIGGN